MDGLENVKGVLKVVIRVLLAICLPQTAQQFTDLLWERNTAFIATWVGVRERADALTY